jgi:hypothetical protein
MFPDGKPEDVPERRDAHLTKKVDGEDLSAHDFIIAQKADDTSTWHLPWHFSTEAKTLSHLRDALSRFDQVQGLSDSEKKTAWNKLVHLCKAHGIDVSEKKALDVIEIDLAKARIRTLEASTSL